MLEALSFTFMQNAVIAALLVSVAVGVIGTLIVVNKTVFVAGAISHASYGAVAVSLFLGIPYLLGMTIFSLFIALLIALFYIKAANRIDAFIAALWAFGMAIGIIFVDLRPGYNIDLMSYLFGSLLSVSSQDLFFMLGLDLVIVAFVAVLYPSILAVSFDKEYAKTRKLPVNLLLIIIYMLIALCIVVSVKSVGLILILALVSIPTYIALEFSGSFLKTMLYCFFLSLGFILLGLSVSYSFNISTGASIIMVACAFFVMFMLTKRFYLA